MLRQEHVNRNGGLSCSRGKSQVGPRSVGTQQEPVRPLAFGSLWGERVAWGYDWFALDFGLVSCVHEYV